MFLPLTFTKGIVRNIPVDTIPPDACYSASDVILVDGTLKTRPGLETKFAAITASHSIAHMDTHTDSDTQNFYVMALLMSSIGVSPHACAVASYTSSWSGASTTIQLTSVPHTCHSASFKDAWFIATGPDNYLHYWDGAAAATTEFSALKLYPRIVVATTSRLWLLNSRNSLTGDDYFQRVQWSDWLDYTTWHTDATPGSSGYIDLLDEPSQIITGIVCKDIVYAFKKQHIYAVYPVGYPKYYESKRVSIGVGCIAARTAKVFRDIIIFLANDGIYFMKDGVVQPVSEQINNRIAERLYMSYSARSFALIDEFNHLYHLFFPDVDGAGKIRSVLTLNLETLGWTEGEFEFGATYGLSHGTNRTETVWESELLVGTTLAGDQVLSFTEDATDDKGTDFTPQYISGVIDALNLTENQVQIINLEKIYIDAESGAVNVFVRTGEHLSAMSAWEEFSLNLGEDMEDYIASRFTGRFFQVKLEFPDVSNSPAISKIVLKFNPISGGDAR